MSRRALGITFLLLVLFSGIVLATDFSTTETLNQELIVSTIRTFNITVQNANTTHNITLVNITIPDGFRFINQSNSTNATATNLNFSAITNVDNTISLLWNNTINGVVNVSDHRFFAFKAQAPSGETTINITVNALDTAGYDINRTSITRTIRGVASTHRNFSSYDAQIAFNVTAVNITIESNVNSTQAYIRNASQQTSIIPSYFPVSAYTASDYLTAAQKDLCVPSSGDGISFNIDSPNIPANTTPLLNETDAETFRLSILAFCPPGRYHGSFTVSNVTNATRNLTITTTIDIPIHHNNTYAQATDTAYVRGRNVTGGNHTYYVFTNLSTDVPTNYTGVTINLTGLSDDVDLFVLNSTGDLVGKAIATGTSADPIVYIRFPATPDRWEIRVGNVSSNYTASLYFSPYNATNQTTPTQEVTILDYGSLEPDSSFVNNYTLENTVNHTLGGVAETAEIYHLTEYNDNTAAQDIEILLPHFTTQVRVGVVWANGSTDWNIIVNDANGTLIANSTNKSSNANVTGVELEEFVLFTGINPATEGLWNVSIYNTTNGTHMPYNVSVRVYFNASEFLTSTFVSTSLNGTFNSSAQENISVNLTVPTTRAMNGTYEGKITYRDSSDRDYQLPLRFQVSGASLMVNNTFINSTVRITDNVGFNRTYFLNVTYNNTGDLPVFFNSTVPTSLNLSATENITLSADLPSSPIAAGGSGTINITLTVDHAVADTAGLYTGMIELNTNNSLVSHDFNLTLNVNLSTALNVTVHNVTPSLVSNNLTVGGNVTYNISVRLLNGTIISTGGLNIYENFTTAAIRETNITGYSVTLVNSTTTGESCTGTTGGVCIKTFTVPENTPGGRYNASATVQVSAQDVASNGGDFTLLGQGSFNAIEVNHSGHNITSNSGLQLGDVDEGDSIFINVTVKNLGALLGDNVEVQFNKGSCPIDVDTEDKGGVGASSCSGSGSGAVWTIDVPARNADGCWLRWELTGGNVSEDDSCNDASVTINNSPTFYNLTGIRLQVEDGGSSSSGSDTSGGGGDTGGGGCSSDAGCSDTQYCNDDSKCVALNCEFDEYIKDHACVKYVLSVDGGDASFLWGEGNSSTVTVTEAADSGLKVELNVTTGTDLDITSVPSSCTTPCSFNVTFNSTNLTEVGVWDGTYTAYYTIFDELIGTDSFSVTVLPTEEKKAEIDAEYAAYLAQITQLSQEFEFLKASGVLSEDDRDLLESLTANMNSLSEEVRAAIDGDDYLKANGLFAALNTSISKVQDKITEVKDAGGIAFGFDLTTMIITIIIVVGVIVFLVYLLLPPKSYGKQRFGPRKVSLGSKIRGIFKRNKGPTYEISKYTKGYDKPKHFVYKKSQHPIKRVLGKKQKRLRDYRK